MRAVSLFSGAGGFEIGFERAGIRTILQAEQDPWCLEVLARHWPDVERVTDVRDVVRVASDPGCRDRLSRQPGLVSALRCDLVYGGFPCQDVSVAGNRAGLGGARSGLWSEFSRVLRELRPTWVCVENVPGLLSSAGGRDFGTILSDLDDLGYGVAWAVLDARFFGVPQRRRRVFIVGCLGNPDAAAAVLAVCESGCGHPQASGEAGQGVAYSLSASTGRSEQGNRVGNAWNTTYVSTLDANYGRLQGASLQDLNDGHDHLVVARGQTARQERLAGDSDNFVVANGLPASDGHHGHSSPRGDGADNLIAFDDRNQDVNEGVYHTLNGEAGMRSDAISSSAGVRRLTPLECERLMGWPDNWTRYTADGREIPDSHRYRLCGNGVVSTVAEWIGHRLVAADRMLKS